MLISESSGEAMAACSAFAPAFGSPPGAAQRRFGVCRMGSAAETGNRKGVTTMPTGQERTKEQLYRQAKSLGIKGRSKMSKGQLKAAIARKGH
jgi:hypothetical protein